MAELYELERNNIETYSMESNWHIESAIVRVLCLKVPDKPPLSFTLDLLP